MREADQKPPASATVKNKWCYTSAPLICFHAVHIDNTTLLLLLLLFYLFSRNTRKHRERIVATKCDDLLMCNDDGRG